MLLTKIYFTQLFFQTKNQKRDCVHDMVHNTISKMRYAYLLYLKLLNKFIDFLCMKVKIKILKLTKYAIVFLIIYERRKKLRIFKIVMDWQLELFNYKTTLFDFNEVRKQLNLTTTNFLLKGYFLCSKNVS